MFAFRNDEQTHFLCIDYELLTPKKFVFTRKVALFGHYFMIRRFRG